MPKVSQPHALVVDVDTDYRAVIARCVELAEGVPELASTPSAALRLLEDRGGFDVVVWGIAPQETNRAELVADFHKRARLPLILLDESYDEVKASFEAGADQVLPKPFVPGALVGAIKAALRNHGTHSVVPLASRIEVGEVIFDSESRTVTKGDKSEIFSRRDWELLTFLLANPGVWFTADQLVREAWRSSRYAPEQLRSYILRLRRKLELLHAPFSIVSRQGSGYRFDLSTSAGSDKA